MNILIFIYLCSLFSFIGFCLIIFMSLCLTTYQLFKVKTATCTCSWELNSIGKSVSGEMTFPFHRG